MSVPLLEQLRTERFRESIGFLLPPAMLRRVLRQCEDVRRAAAALRRGELTERDLASFTEEVTGQFNKGNRLPDDLALAAVAVVLEHWPFYFAEEFLHDLARLHLAELNTSIQVARECLKNRYALPTNQVRIERYPGKHITPAHPLIPQPERLPQAHSIRVLKFPQKSEAV